MKIFSAAQVKACDAYTIQASSIRSEELMERAAAKCVAWIKDHLPRESLFVVLCGTGNNGGDGLAIARQLHQRGYGVKAFLLQLTNELSADCRSNLMRLQNAGKDLVSVVMPDTFITDIPANIIVIDAIFGTGLNRPASAWAAAFIDHVNHLPNRKIAIDMPSGLPADLLPDDDASIVKAGDTLSFQFYKRSFMHPEAARFAGRVHILDINLDKTFIQSTQSQYKTIDDSDAASIYKPRDTFGHKGSFGRSLLIGGSYGKMGAITLAAKAALRAGAGLVTAIVPGVGYDIMQTSVPEAMCVTSGDHEIESIGGWEDMTAIGLGPGLGTDQKTIQAFTKFITASTKPIVVDADALNMIAKNNELLAKLPHGSILTPHPKEFARLFGENTNSMIQVDHARIQAMRYNINIVLKGHHTAVITTAGECWYNMTGNAGMATGGAGDTLTGIITGLLSCGYAPHDAALLGVYLHGLAGDLAAKELSPEALIASDIIGYLGQAFLTLAS